MVKVKPLSELKSYLNAKEVQLNMLLRSLVAAHPENDRYAAELQNSNERLGIVDVTWGCFSVGKSSHVLKCSEYPGAIRFPDGKVLYAVGIGKYPYECIAKDKHPDAMIYEDESCWDKVILERS